MTEAAKMTAKSKTVTLERRAGDLTALYCMHDWMVVLVLAVIAILTVWAGLIIYEYIQTIRGKRRKGDVVDTIQETEKEEKDNTNEENESVASTEESEVVSGTLKSWEEDGWKKEPIECMPPKNGNEQTIEEIPTTNEDEEPIGEIPVTSEDVEQISTNPTITNEDVGGIEDILTMPHVDLLCGTQKRLLECPGDYSTVCSNENLTDILTDNDLQEPGDLFDRKTKETENQPAHFGDVETDQFKPLDIEMASHVAAKVFSDVDLTEALPEHRCKAEMAGVKCPGVMTGPDAKEAPEETAAMTLTFTDVDKNLPDDLCVTEMEEIKYPEDMTSCVVFANQPQDEKLMSFSDTGLQSEIECVDYNRHCNVAVANALETRNLPELGSTDILKEPEHLLNMEEEVKCQDHAYCPSDDTENEEPVYVVENKEEGVECPFDEQIYQNPEHLGENHLESDPGLQEPHNVCHEETPEVEFIGANTDNVVEAIEDVLEVEPAVTLSDHDLQEPDNLCEAVKAEAPCPVRRLDVTTPVGLAIESQEESHDGTLPDAEKGPGMKVEDVECPEVGLRKAVSEMASVNDDVVIGCAVEGFMEAGDGDIVSKKEVEREDEESVDRLIEESYGKVEINIMEATMDCNEWMAVSGTDTQKHTDSIEFLGEMEQRQPIDPPDDLADSSKVREARIPLESLLGDLHGKKMAATLPIKLETVTLRFCIHYHTHSPQQELAVTGNQPELGSWKGFVPLERGPDGFWVSSVLLPVERQVEWKFVLVEDGLIKRWEECVNRCLETGSGGEEVMLHKWWGCL
ncbi:uncharacterized protein stbd1 [Esox lucius]|nr:uncharacterized protein stbd1 [Esox lucius]